MLEEYFGILDKRHQQLTQLVGKMFNGGQYSWTLVTFQFQEYLRREKEKKMVETFGQISNSSIFNQDVRLKIKAVSEQYRTDFKDYCIEFERPSSCRFVAEQLKRLVLSTQKIVETVRFRIAKQHPNSWITHLKMTFTTDKFKHLLECYGQRTGLGGDLADQNGIDNYGTSISELMVRSSKANIKISKDIREYEIRYHTFKNKLKRKKQKKPAHEEFDKIHLGIAKINSSLPHQKDNSLIHDYSTRKEALPKNSVKIVLPPSLKRIEFPSLAPITTFTGKKNYPYIHSFLRKNQLKKISTLPSEYTSKSTAVYNLQEKELNHSINLQKRLYSTKKLKGRLDVSINSNNIGSLRIRKRQNVRIRHEKAKQKTIQESTTLCFDDQFLKQDLDQRLFISNRGSQ